MNVNKMMRRIEYWERVGRPDYYFSAGEANEIRHAVALSIQRFFEKLREI